MFPTSKLTLIKNVTRHILLFFKNKIHTQHQPQNKIFKNPPLPDTQ